MPDDKANETREEHLARIVSDCIAKGRPDKRRQFLDVPDLACPFSLNPEIEGVDPKRKSNDVPCPYIGHEAYTRLNEDDKTKWYYRLCYRAVSQSK